MERRGRRERERGGGGGKKREQLVIFARFDISGKHGRFCIQRGNEKVIPHDFVALSRLAARISSSRQTRLFVLQKFRRTFVTLLDDTPTNPRFHELSFLSDAM